MTAAKDHPGVSVGTRRWPSGGLHAGRGAQTSAHWCCGRVYTPSAYPPSLGALSHLMLTCGPDPLQARPHRARGDLAITFGAVSMTVCLHASGSSTSAKRVPARVFDPGTAPDGYANSAIPNTTGGCGVGIDDHFERIGKP
jgi:hypothetical protein